MAPRVHEYPVMNASRLFALVPFSTTGHHSRSGSGVPRWYALDWSRRCGECGSPAEVGISRAIPAHNRIGCRGVFPEGPEVPPGMDCDDVPRETERAVA